MILSFSDDGTRDIFFGEDTRAARKTCPRELWSKAGQRLEDLDGARVLDDLATPPGNRLERLSGDRAGQYSIRINRQYRICFWWMDKGAAEVEIVDYH